jgi:YD repeat-containing protein
MDAEMVTIDADGSGPLPAVMRHLERTTDTLGRPGGTAVLEGGGGTTEHFTNYGYDNSGRLSTVTSPAGSFSYTYTPNSSLIATGGKKTWTSMKSEVFPSHLVRDLP